MRGKREEQADGNDSSTKVLKTCQSEVVQRLAIPEHILESAYVVACQRHLKAEEGMGGLFARDKSSFATQYSVRETGSERQRSGLFQKPTRTPGCGAVQEIFMSATKTPWLLSGRRELDHS